jgi:hypothetical protein
MGTGIIAANGGKTGLTWGKALKGVALVSAVAVAAVAAFTVVGAVINPAVFSVLASDFTASTLAGTAVQGFTYAAQTAVGLAGTMAQYASAMWAAIPSFFGIAGNSLATPAIAASAAEIGGMTKVMAGGAAAALGAVAIKSSLASTLAPDMTAHTDSNAAMLSQMNSSPVMHNHHISHATADLSTHAAHHSRQPSDGSQPSPNTQPRGSWLDAFSSKRTDAHNSVPVKKASDWSSQFAASTTNPSTILKSHSPRDPNFVTQLDADRTHLRDILNQSARS